MSFRSLVLGLAASTALAAPALAQDADVYFEGPYVSGSVSLDAQPNSGSGIVFDTNQDGAFGDTVRHTSGADAFSAGFCNGRAISNSAADGCSNDKDGLGYALRLGYDTRLNGGPIVAGLLVEGAMSNAKDYSTGFSITPAGYSVSRELDYALALRGRLGISPGDGRGLFYVTGGVGYAKIKHGIETPGNTVNAFTEVNDGKMVLGGQIGGGAELMLTRNLGIGIEYLHSRYDDDKYFVNVGNSGTTAATNPFLLVNADGTNLRPSNTAFATHSLRATASLRF